MKPWSQEKSLQLIELYKQRPVLWDKRDKDYKNNETKADAWAEICSIIGMRDAEKKMNILNVQYRRELKRALINQSVTYDYKNVRKWFAFDAMSFLKEKMLKRRSEILENKVEQIAKGEKFNSDSLQNHTKRSWNPGTHSIENIIDHSSQQYDQEPINKNLKVFRDEFSTFGEIVAIKLRKMPTNQAKNETMNRITDILFEMETKYSKSEYDDIEMVYIKTCEIPENT